MASKHHKSDALISKSADHLLLPVIAGKMNRDEILFPTS